MCWQPAPRQRKAEDLAEDPVDTVERSAAGATEVIQAEEAAEEAATDHAADADVETAGTQEQTARNVATAMTAAATQPEFIVANIKLPPPTVRQTNSLSCLPRHSMTRCTHLP
jgi:FtsZ-interacting cell division protein ZipA